MISIDSLMGIIATEAIEGEPIDNPFPEPRKEVKYDDGLPPIRYDLQLIEQPDGSLVWVE
jgi:hypothetical protein